MTLLVNDVSEQVIAVFAVSIATVPRACFCETRVIFVNGGKMVLQIGTARLLATLDLTGPGRRNIHRLAHGRLSFLLFARGVERQRLERQVIVAVSDLFGVDCRSRLGERREDLF